MAFSTNSETEFDPYAEWLGIAAEERPVDHYRLLGLPRFENDTLRIQAAADHWMSTVRKQQIGRRAGYTQQLLNELSSAKLCLLNPQAKAEYDTRLIEATRDRMGLGPNAPPQRMPGKPFAPAANSPWLHGATLPRIVLDTSEPEPPAELPWVTMMVMFTGFAIAAVVVGVVVFTRMNAQQVASEQAKDPPKVVVIEQPPPPPLEIPLEPNELQQDGAGNLTFVFDKATLLGEAALLDSPQGQVLAKLKTANDGASWKFRAVSAGFFLVEMEYMAPTAEAGKIELEILAPDSEPQKRVFSLRRNEVPEDATDPAAARQTAAQTPITDRFSIAIKKKGTVTLVLRAVENQTRTEVLRVKSVSIRANRLKRAGE